MRSGAADQLPIAIRVPVRATTLPLLSLTSAGQLIAIVLSLVENIAIFCFAVFPTDTAMDCCAPLLL